MYHERPTLLDGTTLRVDDPERNSLPVEYVRHGEPRRARADHEHFRSTHLGSFLALSGDGLHVHVYDVFDLLRRRRPRPFAGLEQAVQEGVGHERPEEQPRRRLGVRDVYYPPPRTRSMSVRKILNPRSGTVER